MRYSVRIRNKSTGDAASFCVPPAYARLSDDDLLRRMGWNPEIWERAELRGSADEPPAPDEVKRVGIVSIGGMGDDLVKLNILRQLMPRVKERYPDAEATYLGRQPYAFFRRFDWIDRWQFYPGKPVREVAALASSEFDLVFDMRYETQMRRRGDFAWSGNPHRGVHGGASIHDALIQSLGIFRFADDGKYLVDALGDIAPAPAERRRLDRLIKRNRLILFSNGYDPVFKQRLTKVLPFALVSDVVRALTAAGFTVAEIGARGAPSSPDLLNLIGKTTLDGLIYLLRRAVGFISNEGGVAHMAGQLGVQCATFYGPTSPTLWRYPTTLALSPSKSACPYLNACERIEPDWHLRCAADTRGELPLVDGFPDCVSSFDLNQVRAALLRFFDR